MAEALAEVMTEVLSLLMGRSSGFLKTVMGGLTCISKPEYPNLGVGRAFLLKFWPGPRRLDSPRRELHNRGADSRNGGLSCGSLEIGRSWIFRF